MASSTSSSDEKGYDSDGSSVLSSPPSVLSSPPPELFESSLKFNIYPTPPHSRSSQTGSPAPDDSSAMNSDKDGPPPRKKRRISERPPRTTEYLDLSTGVIDPDEQVQLDRLLSVLHKRQKIVVVAGAGISVSAGIPDFRSSTGLFTSLRSQHNLKGSGKDLFDASVVYKDASSTSSFHDMVRNMAKMTKAAKPTPFHHMLATLSQQDRLLRLYSQNVDGIDTSLEPLKTEIPLQKDKSGKWPRTVQLHGGLDKMVCSKCHDVHAFVPDLFDGPVPPVCSTCEGINKVRTETLGKRSHGVGMLRPRMVLYNEHNPDDEAIGSVTREDLRKRPDAIIVVGTTLKVPGVKRIVREMCATVRDRRDGVAIWINNDPEPSGKEFEDCWDIIVKGKCDDVARMAALGEWDRQGDCREVTQQSVERASKPQLEVLVEQQHPNSTFKKPRAHTPGLSPERPRPSPLSGRKTSAVPFIEDSFDSDVPVDFAETPSRRPSKAAVRPAEETTKRTIPSKKITELLAPAKAATTAAPSRKAKEPAKKSNVKNVKPNAKAAATKATGTKKAPAKKADPKSKQGAIPFKTSKTVSVAAGKGVKGRTVKDVDPNLQPISPQDGRVNLSTSGPDTYDVIKVSISDSEEERLRKSVVA